MTTIAEPTKKPRQPQQRRQETEERLLDALETVIQRDGLSNLGVNAVIEEAGVTKPLLYRYFGNLEGLIHAWGERRRIWPLDFMPPGDAGNNDHDTYFNGLMRIASHLKEHPLAAELLAVDLQPNSELGEILDELKQQAARQIQPQLAIMTRQDTLRFNLTFYSAIVYLSLRARHAPQMMGLNLDTEGGWATVMAMLRTIMDDIKLAAEVRALAKKNE